MADTNPMTPSLRELLEAHTANHPTPWFAGAKCDCIFDANERFVMDWSQDEAKCDLFVSLVNAAAAEVGR